MTKFYLTTPIYYVNDVPHVGHAYTTIATDVLARYHRSRGNDVFFLTGTDEHGAKVAEAAASHGKTPGEFVDEIVGHFRSAWQQLDISNDYFVRTSDARHEAGVSAFLQKWYLSGDIYKGIYQGLYCVGCERFYSEDELVDGVCPDHLVPPIAYSEENYFFRLSKYQDILIQAITDPNDPNHFDIQPVSRRNEILGKLRLGLQDLSISRGNLAWGVPLPFDTSHTAYVWVDALLNYITAIGYGDNPETFARYWPADLHLMAKEILWFHTVIWPAMLISNGVAVPKKVYAHGYFTINGRKMSKSLGNVIAPSELVERYGSDATRYLLLSEFPFGVDGNISFDSFNNRYNSDLANDLGNLLNRSISMVNRYFEGRILETTSAVTEIDRELRESAVGLAALVERSFANLEFSIALEAIRTVVSKANRYVEVTQPWTLAKTDRERLALVLGGLLRTIRLVAIELQPVMPNSIAGLFRQLGLSAETPGGRSWDDVPGDAQVAKTPVPLFPKIDVTSAGT